MENTALLVHHVLYLLILIFICGILAGKLSSLLKVPDVVLFLVAGIVLGQAFHLVSESSNSFTNQFILTLGATLILFDGGRNIQLSTLRKVWPTVVLLSVPGVLITAVVVAYAVHFFLHVPLLYAFLLASIIASTDPATLIPVFKQVKIRKKVKETVESESAFNDATGSILTFSVLAVITGTQQVTIGGSVLHFLEVALGGILVGVVIGSLTAYLVSHIRIGFFRDFTTIAMVVTSLASYLIGDVLHLSGFMATFVAGLIWGNPGLFRLNLSEKETEIHHFSENITVIMRMLIFILLGSQVNFGIVMKYLAGGLLVIFVFMFIARPLTVLLCAIPDKIAKWTWKEIIFMSWVRETGVIPAALSGMVAGMKLPYADIISSVTFLAILLTILLQGSTTAYAAKKLGVEEIRQSHR